MNSLLSRLKLKSLDSMLSFNRLHWFRHLKRSELYTGQIFDLEVEGNINGGLPKKGCVGTIKDDLKVTSTTKVFFYHKVALDV